MRNNLLNIDGFLVCEFVFIGALEMLDTNTSVAGATSIYRKSYRHSMKKETSLLLVTTISQKHPAPLIIPALHHHSGIVSLFTTQSTLPGSIWTPSEYEPPLKNTSSQKISQAFPSSTNCLFEESNNN